MADFGASYDAVGRVKTVAYNNGTFTVTYVYDEKTGLLKQVTDSLTKTQIDFTYDKDLRLTNIARSNKVNTTLTWDNADRLIGLKDGEVSDLQYTLDDAGQVTQLSGKLPLDPSPNLQSQISNLQYDKASQVSTDGYKYDAQGRLTASPTNKLSWDADTQLIGVDSVKLSYNGLGEVISREEGGKVTRFAYNYALGLAPIVAELQDAKPTRYYVWTPSGALLYAIDASDSNKVSHYHFDRIGSTLALTDSDGKMTDAYAYDPYGKILKHDGKNSQPFTFVGKWGVRQESATLYQMRARYYDTTTAKFLSRDPIWPQITDAQEMNPYLYVRANPIGLQDPTGLSVLVDEICIYIPGQNIWAKERGCSTVKEPINSGAWEFNLATSTWIQKTDGDAYVPLKDHIGNRTMEGVRRSHDYQGANLKGANLKQYMGNRTTAEKEWDKRVDEWFAKHEEEKIISPRCWHILATDGKKIWSGPGSSSSPAELKDTWGFNLTTCTWIQETDGPAQSRSAGVLLSQN